MIGTNVISLKILANIKYFLYLPLENISSVWCWSL